MKYSETRHLDPVDWNRELEKAPSYPEGLQRSLHKLASNWTTCACGNLCDRIPRDEDGCPEDAQLMFLGQSFTEAIGHKEWDVAKQLLNLIEIRSGEILMEYE